MSEKIIDLKDGIKAHLIKNDIFKTNLICLMFTLPLNRETATKNALLPLILKRGSKGYPTTGEISMKLADLYGAGMDISIDKVGDYHTIKIYFECIDNKYTLGGEDLFKEAIDMLFDIAFNPYMVDNKFDENYFKTEKSNLQTIIESKVNNKDVYAYNRCIETMYENDNYGIYKYGYTIDLSKITNEEISNYYKEFINKAKIDLFISGNYDEKEALNTIKNNENYIKLAGRNENRISTKKAIKVEKVRNVLEQKDITQGKIVIGYDCLYDDKKYKEIGSVFNCILGDGANSFLFQNVREKEGLAYTAYSAYNKLKNSFFVRCGIESKNYKKTINLVETQVNNIKAGKFTDDDLENAKTQMIAGLKSVMADQDAEIIYYISQEISNYRYTPEEYINTINSITRKQVIDFAKLTQLNTIYFLTSN